MADNRPLIVETDHRGSGSGWVIAAVIVLALIVGVVFLSQFSGSESAKDSAVANAAGNVGEAARDVGTAAEEAVGNSKQ